MPYWDYHMQIISRDCSVFQVTSVLKVTLRLTPGFPSLALKLTIPLAHCLLVSLGGFCVLSFQECVPTLWGGCGWGQVNELPYGPRSHCSVCVGPCFSSLAYSGNAFLGCGQVPGEGRVGKALLGVGEGFLSSASSLQFQVWCGGGDT